MSLVTKEKKVDWTVFTNKVVNLTVDTVEFAEVDDIYVQYEEGNATPVATGQLSAYSSDTLTMSFKNITGAFVTSNNNVIVSKYKNTEFEYTVSQINQTVVNIPEGEAQYWSAVSAYDYEMEQNQKKKEIVLLRNSQKNKAEEQLTELLRS